MGLRSLPQSWKSAAEREAFFTPELPKSIQCVRSYEHDAFVYCHLLDAASRVFLTDSDLADSDYPGMLERAVIAEVEIKYALNRAIEKAWWHCVYRRIRESIVFSPDEVIVPAPKLKPVENKTATMTEDEIVAQFHRWRRGGL